MILEPRRSPSMLLRRLIDPPCAIPCLTSQPTDNCNLVDTACLCRSTRYVQAVVNCIYSTCNSADYALAIEINTAACIAVGVSVFPSVTTPGPPAPTTSNAAGAQPSTSVSTSNTSSDTLQQPNTSSNTGTIVGAVVGGVLGTALLIGAMLLYLRRKRRGSTSTPMEPANHPHYPAMTNGVEHAPPPMMFQPPLSPQSQPWTQGVGLRSTPSPVPIASGTMGEHPPAYQDSTDGFHPPAGGSTTSALLPVASHGISEVEQHDAYEDQIGRFCVKNRDLISPALEAKLRAARYLPTDNPSELPADHWRTSYGVDFFDQKRLHEAYNREVGNAVKDGKEKASPSVGQGGAVWRPGS